MKKFLVYGGIILAILLMLYFGIGFWLVSSTGARVAARRAAIEAAGDKVYLTEYATEPIPDEENAHYYLMLAKGDLEAIDAEFYEFWDSVGFERRLTPAQVDTVAKIVDKYPALYDRLEQAAACEKYDAKLNYDEGMFIELEHINTFRHAARAFRYKALAEAYRGNGDAALKQCEESLRLSSHLNSEPILVSQLVTLACQAIAVIAANDVLRIANTSPAARAALDDVLQQLDNRQAMVDAMKGERAFGIHMFQQMRDGTLGANEIDGPGALDGIIGTRFGQAYLNDDEAKYIDVLDQQINAIDQDRRDRIAEVDAMWDEIMDSNRFRHVITKLMAPALNAAVNATERNDAKNRCLRILLAIEDQTEATLDQVDLPATAKIDPYSGGPLLLKRIGDEWIVYSVGENELDDGGDVLEDESSFDQPLDLGLGPLAEPLENETEVETEEG